LVFIAAEVPFGFLCRLPLEKYITSASVQENISLLSRYKKIYHYCVGTRKYVTTASVQENISLLRWYMRQLSSQKENMKAHISRIRVSDSLVVSMLLSFACAFSLSHFVYVEIWKKRNPFVSAPPHPISPAHARKSTTLHNAFKDFAVTPPSLHSHISFPSSIMPPSSVIAHSSIVLPGGRPAA